MYFSGVRACTLVWGWRDWVCQMAVADVTATLRQWLSKPNYFGSDKSAQKGNEDLGVKGHSDNPLPQKKSYTKRHFF